MPMGKGTYGTKVGRPPKKAKLAGKKKGKTSTALNKKQALRLCLMTHRQALKTLKHFLMRVMQAGLHL